MPSKGFTLIELLVSMSLLSMTILVGSSAFGLLSQRWDGRLGHFDDTMHNAQSMILVHDVLNSLVPYVVYDNYGRPTIYFEGNRNGFVGVSSKSIYAHGNFAVVRFSVSQNLDLTYDVLYEEWPMDDALLHSINQTLDFRAPLVLFASINDPIFSYNGIPERDTQTSSFDEFKVSKPQWFDAFNSIDGLPAPLKTSLQFSSPAGEFSMLSIMSEEVPGILSRYKTNPSMRLIPSNNGGANEDCDC